MRDALKSYLALAAGVTDITRQRALAAAKALVTQGEATAEQVTGLAEDLVSQTRQNREAVVALVGFEVDRTLGRLGLASSDEVTQLTARVHELEAQVRQLLRSSTGTTGAAAQAAGTTEKVEAPAKKAPAKKAAKAPAKKAATAPAKKASGTSVAKAPGDDPADAPSASDAAGGPAAPESGESPA